MGRGRSGGSGRQKAVSKTTRTAPRTIGEYSELGRVHEMLEGKSADELKKILSEYDDIGVGDVGRLRNPDKIREKILNAVYENNLKKATADHNWGINAINRTDGADRTEILGITIKQYSDADAAKKWYRNWSKITHPDNNPGNPGAKKAFDEVAWRYKRMRKVAK